MSDTWTTTYMQHGTKRAATFTTLRGAVRCAADGDESGSYAVTLITGSGGEVYADDELSDVVLHFMLGEDDHSPERVAKWKPLLDR